MHRYTEAVMIYRISILPYGLFVNEKMIYDYNKQLKWYLRKATQKNKSCIDVIIKGVSSKKRLLQLARENQWDIANPI